MENLEYLFAAYSVIWVVIFGYLFVLHKRIRGLKSELDAINKEGCNCK